MSQKVTDSRDYLGDFAPIFAGINDDVLFGQVWSREAHLAFEADAQQGDWFEAVSEEEYNKLP